MKITRGHLRALIKETIITESGWEGGVSAADPLTLIEFAKAYAKVGAAVQEQFDQLVEGYFDSAGPESPEWEEAVFSVNPNAVDMLRREMRGMNEGLDEMFEDYDTMYNAEGPEA
jgi:hypothetical protein